jgi:hypothetical protein
MSFNALQETTPTDWSGLTTDNHLYNIFAIDVQKASDLVTLIHQINNGMDLDTYLSQFPVLTLDSDEDFRWMLQGNSRKNVPLIRAEINGTAVTATDKPGIGGSRFTLVFAENYFSDTDMIVGEKNERYPVRILAEPLFVGSEIHYECELFTNDPDLFIPYDELIYGKRFSKEWNPVERTLSSKGGTVNYTSPFSMINAFSMVRMEDTRPGNMIAKPVSFSWKVKGKTYTTWMQYADYEFESQFRESISRALMFATSNKTSDGLYLQRGKSGYEIRQGAGIKQQMDSTNVAFFNEFDIEWLTEMMLDMSVNKLTKDERKFTLRTGEWGMVDFSRALEDYTAYYTPLMVQQRVEWLGENTLEFRGQFLSFKGPQGIDVSLQHEPMNDDPVRNKILHPNGGLAESRVYYILDMGTSNGGPNIQKVKSRTNGDIRALVPGLRSNPFAPTLQGGFALAANPVDGYSIHRMETFGSKITDPTRTASFRPAVLAEVGVVY